VRRRLQGVRLDPPRRIEIVEEIAGDLEERLRDLVARGVPPDEAERQVLAELDAHGALGRELARVERLPREPLVPGAPRGDLPRDLWSDLRYGARSLARTPGFTAITVLSLALGIGANTAIFQMLSAVHMRTVPVANPGELASVRIHPFDWASGGFYSWHSDLTNPMWERIRDRQEVFSGVLAWGDATFNLAPAGEVRNARGISVSGGYFTTLGVPPFLGRVLTPADDRRGCGAPGAVVSHGFWQRELGGDPGTVGRRLRLDGHEVEILGVTPPGFTGLEVGRDFDVAVPICMDDLFRGDRSRLDQRSSYWLSVVGRLEPGVSIEAATSQLQAISPGIFDETVPEKYPPSSVEKYRAYRLAAFPAATGISNLREQYSKPLYFLLATAGLVLLIACANLANLLLARASAREREIAVRLALGASRGRLVRQLMTESLLLAALGAAAGLWLAGALSRLLVGYLSTRDDRLVVDLAPDWRVLGFTLALGVLTCLLFGLAPALRASRADLGLVLKAAGGHGATVRRFGLRRLLVAFQVALSFVLLAGALFFARSLQKLATVDTGFDEAGVLIVSVDLRRLELPVERRAPVHQAIVERVRAVPGVAAAASTAIVPISGDRWNQEVEDAGAAEDQKGQNAWFTRVSEGYFATLGTPLRAGRDVSAADTLGAPAVAVVNEAVGRKLYGGESPLGKRIRVSASSNGPAWTFEVVGLVADSKYGALRAEEEPIVYLSAAQEAEPPPSVDLVVRREGPLAGVVTGVKAAVAEAAPLATFDIDSLERRIRDSILRERLMATLSGFFGLLAAILATIGLYGVVAYGVARRTQEIGIRMALGAGGRRIASMILRETGVLLAVGLGAGVLLALAALRLASSMLYGLPPHDVPTLGMALALMVVVTLVAAALPARRAARVDPMVALKDE
jgi:putative ABC transport system permease protein